MGGEGQQRITPYQRVIRKQHKTPTAQAIGYEVDTENWLHCDWAR